MNLAYKRYVGIYTFVTESEYKMTALSANMNIKQKKIKKIQQKNQKKFQQRNKKNSKKNKKSPAKNLKI